ncbi:MAG: TagF domain-containing protein [Pedobacter sp.]
MLELMPTEQKWSWNACGKHPVAKDFIRLGRRFPLSISMEEWVDKGYQAVTCTLKTGRQPQFWRFWTRGNVNDELICGVLRDSSDSIGREYPLLVVGAGTISSWEEQWDLLPGACEGAWNRIEYLCTRNPLDLAGMGQELLKIRPPEPDWQDYRTTWEAGIKALQDSPTLERMDARLKRVREEQELRMELDNGVSDQLILVSHILSRIKAAGKGSPNTVFIGGTFDVACLVMYWRPLVVGDFIELWK